MYSKDYWLKLEAETRLLASNMTDPEARHALTSIAEGYRRLAERAQHSHAKKVIDGAAFGPEALKIIWAAFDSAWAEIEPNLGNDERYAEAARYKLATALLSAASEESGDPIALKRAALQRTALDYR
jgi:hypothetical protein